MVAPDLQTVAVATFVSFDPYQVLDIKRTATAAQIKQAFRKAARNNHPDTGGTAEKFNDVMRANLILSDPIRRKRFDEDGVVDERKPEQSVPAAMQHIIGFFCNAVVQAASQNVSTCQVDLVQAAKNFFNDQINQLRKQKDVPTKANALAAKVVERIKTKNKNDLLKLALKNQIREGENNIRQLDERIVQMQDAITLLRDYEFVVEKVEPQYAGQAGPYMHRPMFFGGTT